MTWHYAAGRKISVSGEPCWEVYEVYGVEDEDENGPLRTEGCITPSGENRLELVNELARMLKDCCYFPAIDADSEGYEELQ